jgi:hypothetical protein
MSTLPARLSTILRASPTIRTYEHNIRRISKAFILNCTFYILSSIVQSLPIVINFFAKFYYHLCGFYQIHYNLVTLTAF